MSEELNADNSPAGDVSDGDLLLIIGRPGAYDAEVRDAARLEAQLRGLIGQFEDTEYKVAATGMREPASLDVATLKRMYLAGLIRRETPVHVATRNQWMPLAQAFDVNRWERAAATTSAPTRDDMHSAPSRAASQTMGRRPTATDNPGGHGDNMSYPPPAPLAQTTPLPPTSYANAPNYTSPSLSGTADYSQYKGVGGWLLLFIIGQLACRPMSMCSAMAANSDFGQPGGYYPITSMVIALENLINFGLLIFGVVVAVGLIRSTTPGIVRLTKNYLLIFLGCAVFDVFLVAMTDLPERAKGLVLGRTFIAAIFAAIEAFIWYQYFSKSRRVRATYFSDEESVDNNGLPNVTSN